MTTKSIFFICNTGIQVLTNLMLFTLLSSSYNIAVEKIILSFLNLQGGDYNE